MNKLKTGFTLVELLVVVTIISILAAVGMPQYMKTVETTKATDALAITQMIANANRMYQIDKNTYASAVATLVTDKYMASHDWSAAAYNYYACNGATGGGCCAAGMVACCQRNATGTYSSWGYSINTSGVCSTLASSSTPPCTGF
ncbi:MAG: hypothetical protein A2285_05955 [Elusimicrobia bacterium RIFOXYA12_FULL_57_11]|nr:MAG: hypothetical protein A2285_05955 [Elusimicrobia bacterium RIFOXYA12_FULL_57_11]